MSDDVFTDDEIAQGKEHAVLGPAYFAARRVCEAAMQDWEAEHLRPLVETIRDKVTDTLWDTIRDSIWSDTEMNLQGKMWDMVDRTVKALLTGERWALERYCLGERYDQELVRAAIARHIPEEIKGARIADLEALVEKQKRDIEWLRR
jgi:hypothetical protein